jgi:hypothetical protein
VNSRQPRGQPRSLRRTAQVLKQLLTTVPADRQEEVIREFTGILIFSYGAAPATAVLTLVDVGVERALIDQTVHDVFEIMRLKLAQRPNTIPAEETD